MIEHYQRILIGQFEASLSMMRQCLEACRPEHWEGKVAHGPFRWVAYHTLFFTDFYLSRGEDAFERCEWVLRGGDELGPGPAPGLSTGDTLQYLLFCREKAVNVIGTETRESLEGPSGFTWRKFSRGELHLYNLRHIQHHTGQLSACLRRVDPAIQHDDLPWIGSGWRQAAGARA
jgi:hypothetical protein